MRYLKLFIISGLVIGLLSGCSAGRRAFSKAEKFEAAGRFEEAMYSYADAFSNDPEASRYRFSFLKARDKAANMRYQMGSELFDKGNYVAALAEFQTAYGLDPTQGRFKSQVEVATRLKDAHLAYLEGLDFEKANKLKDANRSFARALELNPGDKDIQAAQARVSGMRKSKLEGYELNLKSNKPITLKFKDAKIKDVFNIVTQLSGINFIFDEGVKDQQVSIYLENATFQQALELLTNMFKLGRKVANESTVIIYAKTPDKVKQYEDMQLRTFHLNYMDAKKAVNLIRTMIQVRKVYVNEDSNSVVVRDTNDIVNIVEKILDANDVPDPEVILDVEVIEVSNTNTQRLGLLLSNYNVQVGAFTPEGKALTNSLSSATTTATTTGTTTTTSTAAVDNLLRAFTMKGYGGFVTVPNATYNFGKTLSKGEVLSNPKIRVKNKEKSKFTVGTRLPITTSNTTNQTVSVNVQYVDVGVKVNAEPTIQLNNEIVIKLSLEVSAPDGAPRDVGGGTSVVTINTRNLETVMSLKDGETSIIGGLIQHTQGDSKNKILLLSDIPLFGSLFTDSNINNTKNELMLAITPRLVRGVTVPQGNLISFSTGKEDDPSLVKPLAAFEQEPEFDSTPKGEEKQTGKTQTTPYPAVKKAVSPQFSPASTGISPLPASTDPVAEQIPAVTPLPAATTEPAATPATPLTSVTPAPAPAPTAPAPAPTAPAPAPAAPAPAPAPAPAAEVPPQGTPSGKQGPGATSPQAVAVPPATAPKTAAPVAAAPPQRGLLQIAAPSSIALGQQFKLEIKVSDVKDLATAPMVLTYDPIFVEYISSAEGEFLKKDGKIVTFSSKVDSASGTVAITLARGSGSGGISGAGTLAIAMFRARNQGPANFGFRNVNFSAADGRALTILPFTTAVDVR